MSLSSGIVLYNPLFAHVIEMFLFFTRQSTYHFGKWPVLRMVLPKKATNKLYSLRAFVGNHP